MKKYLLAFLAVIVAFPVFSQTPDREEMIKNIRKGNSAYKEGKYEEAEVSYRRAMEVNPASFDPIYNLANTEYKKDNIEAAQKYYSSVLSSTEDKEKKAWAYHNLGNTFLSEEKYKESIDAYKSALKLRPNDIETKTNLAYAQKKLADQQDQGDGGGGGQDSQNNQDPNQQDNPNQQNDQNQGQQDNQGDQNQQENQNQEGQGNQNQENGEQDPKDGQGQQPKISPQEAQQLLEAIQADERNTQEKVNKEKAKLVGKQRTEKNW